jgi:hypothetical protein
LLLSSRIGVVLSRYGETRRRAVRIVHVQLTVAAADAENLYVHTAALFRADHSFDDFECCPVCVDNLLVTEIDLLTMMKLQSPVEMKLCAALVI